MIGLAGPEHHEWLSQHGVIPVNYRDRVAGRIREAAPAVDALIDTFGADYVELALELGVPAAGSTRSSTSAPSSGTG